MAHFIECLGDINENHSGGFICIKPTRIYICSDSCNLLNGQVGVTKTKLCVRVIKFCRSIFCSLVWISFLMILLNKDWEKSVCR